MSRIGRKAIAIPAKVEVKINGNEVSVKGPRGELSDSFNPDMTIKIEDGHIIVQRPTDLRHHRALHGLTRALIANMVTGVSAGFRKQLEVEGIGYQAVVVGKTEQLSEQQHGYDAIRGTQLELKVGLSHQVIVDAPDNVTFEIPKESRGRTIIIEGIDKQVVGQIAAEVRERRPPEPYKGKGIRYADEYVRRKAGKAGKK